MVKVFKAFSSIALPILLVGIFMCGITFYDYTSSELILNQYVLIGILSGADALVLIGVIIGIKGEITSSYTSSKSSLSSFKLWVIIFFIKFFIDDGIFWHVNIVFWIGKLLDLLYKFFLCFFLMHAKIPFFLVNIS